MYVFSDLDWTVHVDMVCKALKQRLGILKRLKYRVHKSKLSVIAEAIFTSKIRYGLAVYSNPRTCEEETEDSELRRLQVLQNDMLRLINGHTRAEHINMKELRARTKSMSVNQLSVYHIVMEMYNVIWRNSSTQLKRKMQKIEDPNETKQLRPRLKIPLRPSSRCCGFSFIGQKIWNQTPIQIREETDPSIFKKELKEWVLKEIPN